MPDRFPVFGIQFFVKRACNILLFFFKLPVQGNQAFGGVKLLFCLPGFFIIANEVIVSFAEFIVEKLFFLKQLVWFGKIDYCLLFLVLHPRYFSQIEINNVFVGKVAVLLYDGQCGFKVMLCSGIVFL